MHVTTMSRQVQNRVTHQLARAMKSDISSSADAIDWHLPRIQQVPLVSASAQGKDCRMLKEEECVFPFFLTPLPEQFFLPGQCLRILNQAKVNAAEIHACR